MNKLALCLAAATLGLAACTSSDDAEENVVVNEPVTDELNQAASDAANDMNADAEALGQQLNELETAPPPAEEEQSPSDAQEQNVAGM